METIHCDVSVFSPLAEPHTEQGSRCDLPSGQCATVTYYFFNTLSSRADLNSLPFQPGGEYNRKEYRCFYTNSKNEAIYTEQGDSLFNAFQDLVKKCPERNLAIENQ